MTITEPVARTLQVTEPTATTAQAHLSIYAVEHEHEPEVTDATAKAIASWHQSPGTHGSVLAALASGAEVNLDDFLNDVHRVRTISAQHDHYELDLLGTWAIARTR